MGMKHYKFNKEASISIVNAIVVGDGDYIDYCNDRHEHMKISSALSWITGNFIESKIAEISSELNLSYKRAKAGLTWDYLQFIHDGTKKLFLIKNAAYFNKKTFHRLFCRITIKAKGIVEHTFTNFQK